jgi:anti-sigma factor RsiW
MVTVTDPEVHALTGAYVCDALDDAERAAFEEHLAQCEACALEVAELRETAAVLGMAAAEAPPERLHAAVTARIEVTRQLAPPAAAPASAATTSAASATPSSPDAPAGAAPPSTAPGGDAPSNVVPITEARSRRLRLARVSRATVAGWTAAAVLAGVAVGLGVEDLAQHHQATRSESRAQQLAALLAAPDVRIGVGQVHGGGTVTFVESRKLNQVAVTLADMPTLPEGKAYQLWMIGPSGVRSGGVVTKAQTNSSTPVLAEGLGNAVTLGMTVEPSAGTTQPTTTPILLLSMPA